MEWRDEGRTLTSPINGVVQQLAVHTVGGIVQPAEALMVIVPENNTLELEA
ncbi:MAG: HlyD family efflux transporter periplasmic adaptor subunit, partial [Rhodospirillales bacterium]